MTITPIFKSGPICLVGLQSDFNSPKLKDGLVVQINLDEIKSIVPPWSFQKIIKFSGYFESIKESERLELEMQIAKSLGNDLISEIIDLLQFPPDESIDSLIWIPERLKNRNELKAFRPKKNRFSEFEIDEKNIEREFDRLASLLLLVKCIKVNNSRFRFTEIEFYFYCDNHQDAFTHEHNLPLKRWRFHNQGIDITLRSTTGFGGILIRGVERFNEPENTTSRFINGPRRVLFEITKYLNPIDHLMNEFGLEDSDKRELKIFKTFRHGLVSPSSSLMCSSPDYYREAKYRYIVNPQYFNKTQFSGAEEIARSFNDKQLSNEFLGYNLMK